MNLRKIFGEVLLLTALSLCIYIVASIGITYKGKSSSILERAWRLDIDNLTASNKLPPIWKDIRLVEKYAGADDNLAESWVKNVYPPIEINPLGQYKLEILFLSQEDNQHKSAVIQHHLIYIPTGDSVWELGRTYDLE